MKQVLFSFFLFFIGTPTFAQQWNTNVDIATQKAVELDKPILLVFKGSDWCGPCIKLDRDVFSTDSFRTYAKGNFVLLEADFPKRKKNALTEEQQIHNNNLADKYNPNGIFPLVVILNNEGEKLGETGYFKSSPSEYINHLNSFIK
ncbi:MAG: thioredoxin family protein [Gilvibacter sp.]